MGLLCIKSNQEYDKRFNISDIKEKGSLTIRERNIIEQNIHLYRINDVR